MIVEYVEEAWAESPRESFRFQGVASITELMSAAMSRLTVLNERLDSQQAASDKFEAAH